MSYLRSTAVIFVALIVICTTGCFEGGNDVKYTKSHEVPALFSKVSFQEAKASAQDSGKVVILDGTATWCAPCKEMDKSSWLDPRVIEWVEQNAVAVQVDVDQETQLAKEHNLNPLPNIVAFRDGKEIGRRIGYHSADELLAWFDELAK